MFDESFMSKILSLVDDTDSYRLTMDTIVDDAFYIHTPKGITHYGRTKDRVHAVNG